MKKILLSLVIILSAQLAMAGGPLKWRLGAIALGANHWMISSGYSYTDQSTLTKVELTPQFTFNTNLGISAGVSFTDAVGIEVDVIFGKYKQDWKLEISDPIGGTSESKFTTEIEKIDIPVLFKAGGLMYFEVGPQFTMIQKVTYVPEEGESVDNTDLYNSSQFWGVIGTGASLEIPKIARIDAGLRLAYGFMDINSRKEFIFDDQAVTQFFWGIKLAAVHEF